MGANLEESVLDGKADSFARFFWERLSIRGLGFLCVQSYGRRILSPEIRGRERQAREFPTQYISSDTMNWLEDE